MSEMTRNGGFTLLELMLTVTVLAVLVGIAVPSFVDLVNRNSVTSASNDLLASILRARSEAVKSEVRVNIKREGTDWSRWRVFTDENANGDYNPGDDPPDVLIEDYFHDGPVPVGNGTVASIIGFSPRGRNISSLNEASDFFQITQGDHVRYICFSPTGRPRVQEGVCP